MSLEARIIELEALNAEYVARAEAAESELARLSQSRSKFADYLAQLDVMCMARGLGSCAQNFRRDPALPATSDSVWCAWVEGANVRGYGRTGERALAALIEKAGISSRFGGP